MVDSIEDITFLRAKRIEAERTKQRTAVHLGLPHVRSPQDQTVTEG
ncbi:hypothetical protein [Streptomyces sp. NPDC015242]